MGGIFSAPATLADRNFQKSLHAALMIWSWGVMIPGTVMLASLRSKQNVVLGAPGPFWFFAHRSLAYAGVSLALAGTLIGRAVASGSEKAAAHRFLGYATTMLGLAQPIIAYYRPSTAEEKEKTGWLKLHRYIGWLACALAAANIRLGVGMWDPNNAISTAYNGGIVSAGALALAWNYKNIPQ
eukprot:m.66475 g.66475  ORF g.66475 m.66475 type:complete len:183 (-) comp23695_c2_seq1:86-634(-)